MSSLDSNCPKTGERANVATFPNQTPPVIVFSSACAGLAGGAVPALAQLASSSYHAAFSSPCPSPPSPSVDENMHKSRTSSTL